LPRFGSPLLQYLLDHYPETDTERSIDAARLVAILDRYSFTERLAPVHQIGDSFRLHNFIRLALADDLARVDPERYRRLHRLAADFYFELLTKEDEENAAGSYGSWFRYEDPGWQLLKQEWLHHLSCGPEHSAATRLPFARVFLDAFWWWGVYVPLEFCSRVIDDLEHVASAPEDAQLANALVTLHTVYPLGYRKPSGPHWNTARVALRKVAAACDLTDLALLRTEEQRHVFGVLNILLAHTWRYDSPAEAASDRYYEQATAAFEQNEDAWNLAWIAYERADLALARGDAAGAFTWCDDAAARCHEIAAIGRPEEELHANVQRVRADTYASLGDPATAVDRYGQAVRHASAFHRTGTVPDEYTRAFYDEMLDRLAAFLDLQVHEADASAATALLDQVRAAPPLRLNEAALATVATDWCATALREGRALDVVHSLFPRGPTLDELGVVESPFMDEWFEVTELLDLRRGIDRHDAPAPAPGPP
jgi:hypothetical protein